MDQSVSVTGLTESTVLQKAPFTLVFTNPLTVLVHKISELHPSLRKQPSFFTPAPSGVSQRRRTTVFAG